jgi:hypothetical protein
MRQEAEERAARRRAARRTHAEDRQARIIEPALASDEVQQVQPEVPEHSNGMLQNEQAVALQQVACDLD